MCEAEACRGYPGPTRCDFVRTVCILDRKRRSLTFAPLQVSHVRECRALESEAQEPLAMTEVRTLAKRQSRSTDSRKRLLALLSVALVILVHRLRHRQALPACRWPSLPPHRAVWLELSRVLDRLAGLLPRRTAQTAHYLQRVQAAVHQRVQLRTREMVQLSMRRILKHLQPLAQQQLEQSVEGMLDRTALHVRVRLKDEAMPPIVQRCVDDLVRGLLRSGLG